MEKLECDSLKSSHSYASPELACSPKNINKIKDPGEDKYQSENKTSKIRYSLFINTFVSIFVKTIS